MSDSERDLHATRLRRERATTFLGRMRGWDIKLTPIGFETGSRASHRRDAARAAANRRSKRR